MKYALCWPIAQALYYIGHWSSILMAKMPGADNEEPGMLFNFFYRIHQWTMSQSFHLSNWAGLGMWKRGDPQ